MALVQNLEDHVVDVVGAPPIAANATGNIDLGIAYNQKLLDDGILLLLDGDVTPPAPPSVQTGLRAIVDYEAPTVSREIDLTNAAVGQVVTVADSDGNLTTQTVDEFLDESVASRLLPAGADLSGADTGQVIGAVDGMPVWALLADARQLAAVPDLLIVGTITRDGNGAATAADVVWPNGDTGVFTATTLSSDFPGAVDAYTITKGAKTYTQAAVTRDSTGAVIDRPAITVS